MLFLFAVSTAMAPVSHPVAPRLFNDFHLAPGLGGIRLAGLAGLADPEVPSGAALLQVAGYGGSHLGSDGTEK